MKFTITKWNIEELNGYKPKTTFWEDFCIAEAFGKDAIIDTFNRAFKEWKDNEVYGTELSLVTNHKIHYFYKRDHDTAMVYNDLWEKINDYCNSHYEGEKAEYYFQWTD